MNNVKRIALWAMLAVVAAVIGMAYLIPRENAEAQGRPTGVEASPGDGTNAIVLWDRVEGATHYRIGWINMDKFRDLSAAEQDDSDVWLNLFAYYEVAAAAVIPTEADENRLTFRIDPLLPEARYAFIVAAIGARFGQLYGWSTWAYAATGEGARSCPTQPAGITSPGGAQPTPTPRPDATPTPTPTRRPQATDEPEPTPASRSSGSAPACFAEDPTVTGDYDCDGNGLIEVRSAVQLRALKHDLDGDGTVTSDQYQFAFPNAELSMGCAAQTCYGYELAASINLPRVDWTPLGNRSKPYDAVFDGNSGDFAITNLTIRQSTSDYRGLFGSLGRNSAVSNLALNSVSVSGRNYVGALAGWTFGSIDGVTVSGSVSGRHNVGGIVGGSNWHITDAESSAAVIGKGNYVGGLVGYSEGGNIRDSWATGNVGGRLAGDNIGGLAGVFRGSNREIFASYATGDVESRGNKIGGLVGESQGRIKASYAIGDVSSPRGQFVGGFLGHGVAGSVSNSYATGAVTGRRYVGGFVGSAQTGVAYSYSTGRVSGDHDFGGFGGSLNRYYNTSSNNCYWDTTTSGIKTGGREGFVGMPTDELQRLDSPDGWNSDWWDFGTDTDYPVLQAGNLSPDDQRH